MGNMLSVPVTHAPALGGNAGGNVDGAQSVMAPMFVTQGDMDDLD
jgi:hypothetical protein